MKIKYPQVLPKQTRIFVILCLMMLPLPSAFTQVFDNAGLLRPAQEAYLEARIASIAQIYNFNLIIITQRNAGELNTEAFADRFSTPVQDGCILLQLTESRDYDFSVLGRGEKILNNTAFDKLENDTVSFLRDNNYYEAYRAFIRNWEEFLALEAIGRNYNFFYQWNIALVAGSWVLAIIIGLTVVLIWKSQMNTALAQTQANAYMIPNSLAFKEKNDRFLYSTVTKTRRQKQVSSSGSSGRSISGRSGKY